MTGNEMRVLVTQMRGDGHTWQEIGDCVGFSASYVHRCFSSNRWPAHENQRPYNAPPRPRLAQVTQVPTLTRKGLIWIHRIKPPRATNACAMCPFENQCREAVRRRDFIACEMPLAEELI